MTTYELRKIREELQQTPRSMAHHLGAAVSNYYLWERGPPIPEKVASDIEFLATQDLPEDPSWHLRPMDALRTRFSPGARFGNLVVVGKSMLSGANPHSRVKVRCDCGGETGVRASHLLSMSHCGRYCKLKITPPQPEKKDPMAELEAAFELLNDEIAPCNDQTPLNTAEWEAGL
jgi:DNA-binding XRE family transcriptional regulator